MNIPTAVKDAQRQALADAVKEYQNRGGKTPRCRMSKRHPKWMSMTTKSPRNQRIVRLTDLITD